MKTITVTIPYEGKPYNGDIYTDNFDCYLARALKLAGHKEVFVSWFGKTTIGEEEYHPIHDFNAEVIGVAFQAGKDVIVTLQQQKT